MPHVWRGLPGNPSRPCGQHRIVVVGRAHGADWKAFGARLRSVLATAPPYTGNGVSRRSRRHCRPPKQYLESLGFAQNFLSSCELEALHYIGIRSFGEAFREDVVFRGI